MINMHQIPFFILRNIWFRVECKNIIFSKQKYESLFNADSLSGRCKLMHIIKTQTWSIFIFSSVEKNTYYAKKQIFVSLGLKTFKNMYLSNFYFLFCGNSQIFDLLKIQIISHIIGSYLFTMCLAGLQSKYIMYKGSDEWAFRKS